MKAKSHIEFLVDLRKKSSAYAAGNYEVLGQYINSKTKLDCRCKLCGHEWKADANHLLRGKACPNYRMHPGYVSPRKKTEAQFIKEIADLGQPIEAIGVYRGYHTNTDFRCGVCGHEWATTPATIFGGGKCPNCVRTANIARSRKSHEQFLSDLLERNPYYKSGSFAVVGRYAGAKVPIKCRCEECQCEFSPTPDALVNARTGCPNCKSGMATSFMEQFIYKAACIAYGDERVRSRDRKLIGEELDVVVFKPDGTTVAFEPGAWNWHKHTVAKDRARWEKCKGKGIDLLTIYDSFPSDATVDLWEGLLTFNYDLGSEPGYAALRRVCTQALQHTFSEEEWSDIWNWARVHSRNKTHDEFISKLMALSARYANGEYTVLGKYAGNKTKIACECTVCGHIWDGIPAHLLRGEGCPNYMKHPDYVSPRKKSHEEFLHDLENANSGYRDGSFELLGEYRTVNDRIRCICVNCKAEWDALPAALLQGSVCPVCTKREVGAKLRKTSSDFLGEVWVANSDYRSGSFRVLGEYRGANEPILCECTKDGYRWEPIAKCLLRPGYGCPKCAGCLKKTHQEFLDELRAQNPKYRRGEFEVLGEYVGMNEKVECRCKKCGRTWNVTPGSLIRQSSGCSQCAGNIKKTHEQFMADLVERNRKFASGQFEVLGQYTGIKNPIACRCCECGMTWNAHPAALLRGSGCKGCSISKTKRAKGRRGC